MKLVHCIFKHSKSLSFFLILLLGLSQQAWAQSSFTPLGDLPGGDFLSYAHAISDDGSVVVGESITENGYESFRWTETNGMEYLGGFPELVYGTSSDGANGVLYYSMATSISSDGSTITGCSLTADPYTKHAFRWDSVNGMTNLGVLSNSPNSCVFSSEYNSVKVTADGNYITFTGRENDGTETVYRWSELSGAVPVDNPLGSNQVRAISAFGNFVAGQIGGLLDHQAYLWSEDSGAQLLGDLPGGINNSTATGVSSDGSIVTGHADVTECFGSSTCPRAFRWTPAEGMVSIDNLPVIGGYYSMPKDISANGNIIVGTKMFLTGNFEAFIWDPVNGIRRLAQVLLDEYGIDTTGWVLIDALDVNPSGNIIVGWGINPSGQHEAWRVVLDVAPASEIDLGLMANNVPNSVNVSQPFSIDYSIYNYGTTEVTASTLDIQLPTGVQLVTSSIPCQINGSQVSCDTGPLALSSSINVSFDFIATEDGVTTLQASVSGSGTELSPLNNQADTTINVNAFPQLTVLSPANNTQYTEGTSIFFQATASDLEDGNLNGSISWESSLDGPIGSGPQFNLSALSIGAHSITIAVSDSAGATTTQTLSILIEPFVNNSPQINLLSPSPGTQVESGTAVSLQASATDVEDGNISAQVQWSSNIDGPLGSGTPLVITTLSVNSHIITVSVTDSNGATSATSTTVTVVSPNSIPAINILSPATGSQVIEGTAISLQASATDLEDGDISSLVEWSSNFDGALGSGSALIVTTLSVNVHTITASITDTSGATSSTTITLTVIPPANTPPVVNIISPTVGQQIVAGTPVNLQAIATDNEDGDISANINWFSSLDGYLGTSPSLTVTLSAGSHEIVADVMDSQGLGNYEIVPVTVTNQQITYCTSQGNSSSYEWINSITVNGNSRTSGNNGGYADFTAQAPLQIAKGSNTLSLTPGFGFGSYFEYWNVWIDLNQDGQFTADERLYTGGSRGSIFAGITLPATAITGSTRMRISMKYGSSPTPCETFTWGEVEDYTVNITN